VPGAGWLGRRRIDLIECESTNDEAARLARAGADHGTIVIAGAQRAGRGSGGRVWASPPGLGLYLSAVVRPPLPLALVPPMTLAIGVGVCDAAREAGAAAARLKWPNDVLARGRKLAGVLVEAQSQGSRLEAVIVGIGVNLGGALPPELGGRATTLAAEAERHVDRARLADALLGHNERWIDRYVAAGLPAVIAARHERMARGLAVRAELAGAPLEGEAAGLDTDGALLVRDAAGELHRIRSGDVDVC
jgi:BirA family biotin operon repressor/biotin-[acetyl-CoA-carboxylase] ligase